MKHTPNYNLVKPDPNDFYNVEDFNANADIVDEELKKLADGSNLTDVKQDITNLQTDFNKHKGEVNGVIKTGGRLSPECKSIKDWNEAVESGWYQCEGGPNSPAGNRWLIGQVIAHYDKYLVQHVYDFSLTTTPQWERNRSAGTWSIWKRLGTHVTALDLSNGVGGTYPDPNTCMDPLFLTNHANMDGPGDFWYVTQKFYSHTDNRSQFATSYNGLPDAKTRHYYNNTWSPWSPSFRSVSEGKNLIANALSLRGQPSNGNEEFASYANKILAMSPDAVSGSGIGLSAGSNSRTIVFTISGLKFQPKEIIIFANTPSNGFAKDMTYVFSSRLGKGTFTYKASETSSNFIGYAVGTPTLTANGFTVRVDVSVAMVTNQQSPFTYVAVP